MNRRDLCKKSLALFLTTGITPTLGAAPADVFETRRFRAVPILWNVVDPRTGKPCRMWLETLRELGGEYRAYTRPLGDLGKFRKTTVTDRIGPVWDNIMEPKFGGPEFYPRFDRALL